MKNMTRKGYGRIYVLKEEDIENVMQIIKDLDEFEFDYLPKNFIAQYTEYPRVVYTHKFDGLDMNKLTATCWEAGIMIWVFDAGHDEFPNA